MCAMRASRNDAAELRPLLDGRRRFLAFVRARVESDAAAEEILQAAFVKSVEARATVRDDESVVAWFYRLLRNAIIDHHRRRDAEGRAYERHARELGDALHEAPPDVVDAVCACIGGLVDTLPAEQAAILRRVDLDGAAVAAAAREAGITANNAYVRLHRARRALRERVEETCRTCSEHGCVDCTCEARAP
jgi:RNA polymerase sigma-70 factor (ECF subfamily)